MLPNMYKPPKSLSDSSTSESEEDTSKRGNQAPYGWGPLKRDHSVDEDSELFSKMCTDASSFKSPGKYSERKFSNDDTEDEHQDFLEPPNKMFKSDFRSPSKYVERESLTDQTDSEEDRMTPMKMTNMGLLNGLYKKQNEHYKPVQMNTEPPEIEMNVKSFNQDLSDQTDGEDDQNISHQNSSNAPANDALSDSYGVGMKLMEKMGYKSGTGLGKYEQGRVNIVEASKQRGRRGLGLTLQGLEPSDVQWDASEEVISLKEDISWIPSELDPPPLDIYEMRNWMVVGKKQESIDEETTFCDPKILKNIVACKSMFDQLEGEELRKARTRSNPFEIIRGGIFLNRAAMKMANMDAAFDFIFSNPKKMNGQSAVGEGELLYFADVCAGPGGFSEYILWRKKWEAKGFGITLKEANDFKLEDFFAGPPESFEPYYGEEGDGNVYSNINLQSFKSHVLSNTDGKGVHFMMADGGFSVEGKENEQEILSKRLYLCQFLCALFILRTGGHFVCKLFDLFTPFSVGLVYLMYKAFDKICIFKPNTSRPANSERYIVCKWLRDDTKDIANYMYEINEKLDKYHNTTSKEDITEVVPMYILKEDEVFFNYIVNSNNVLGAKQITHLRKIRTFAQNANLHEDKQNDIRKECLEIWKVPDEVRKAPKPPKPEEAFKQLLQGETLSYLSNSPPPLTEVKILGQIFDFHCVVCGAQTTLFVGLGKSNVYQYDSKNLKWNKVDLTLELPADTLFYGEVVSELKGEARGQRKINALHIIDALFLGGIDVRNFHFEKRIRLAEKLVKAVTKTSRIDMAPLRVKDVWHLPQVEKVFDRLAMKFNKNTPVPRLSFDLGENRHIVPTGLLIIKTTADPWITAYSKTSKKCYFFNTKKNISSFEKVQESCANFKSCFMSYMFWSWEKGVRLIPEQNVQMDPNAIQGHTVTNFVRKQWSNMTGHSL